jgi:hypothetical protein
MSILKHDRTLIALEAGWRAAWKWCFHPRPVRPCTWWTTKDSLLMLILAWCYLVRK